MKKRGIITLGVVVAVATVALALVFFNPFSSRKVAPITDAVVLYINGGQLVKKGAIEKFISPENRKLMASAAVAELENRELADYFTNIASDLDETGISLYKPAYFYMNGDFEQNIDGVLVVEVHDVEKVDKFVAALSDLAVERGALPIEVKRVGDKRSFILADDDVYVGYDDTRIVAAVTEQGNGEALMTDALNRPFSDLSVFGKRDIAVYADIDQLITLGENNLNNLLAEYEYGAAECEYDYEVEWYEENIESVNESLAQLAELRMQLGEEASTVSGLTFESGRVVWDVAVDANEYSSDMLRKVNNSHLQSVSQDAIAVLNMGVDGKLIADFVKSEVTPDFASMLNVNRNEFNFVLQLVCDALSSVEGDFTFALEGVEGTQRRYGGMRFNSADLLAIADVKDRYIIDNVSQFGAGFLLNDGEDKYSARLADNMSLYVGQSGDVCYVGMNREYVPVERSASDAAWTKNVKSSLMYLVLDVDNMMNSSYIYGYYNEAMRRVEPEMVDVVNAIVESSDYLCLNFKNFHSAELVWVLDNSEVNALEQIVEKVLPLAMGDLCGDCCQ